MYSRRTFLTQLLAAGAGATVAPALLRGSAASVAAAALDDPPATRNVLQWPYAQNSIWNMPIGSAARYHDPGWDPLVVTEQGYQADQDILILSPGAPARPLWQNNGGFGQDVDRCVKRTTTETPDGVQLATIRIPDGFAYHEGTNAGEIKNNACWTAVNADGRTTIYGSSFARCAPHPGLVLSRNLMSTWSGAGDGRDLFGPGRHGSHGGTQLSSLGGCLRVGELRPGGPRIRHALRVGISNAVLYRPPDWTTTTHPTSSNWVFRWPAYVSDAWTSYQGTDPEVRAGTLYAIHRDVNIDNFAASWAGAGHGPPGNLETEPGKQIAWTMQNYGAYHSDATPAKTMLWDVEVGTNGRFEDQFSADWGISFIRTGFGPSSYERLQTARRAAPGTGSMSDRWVRDLDRIFARFRVVANNGPTSVGGGGTPRQPLAPPFA